MKKSGILMLGIILVVIIGISYNISKIPTAEERIDEDKPVGLIIHYYDKDGNEIHPDKIKQGTFSVVDGVPDVAFIAFDISASNIGEVGLENFKIVSASPQAFKDDLPTVGEIIGGTGGEVVEKFETGLVNWNQVTGDDLDWTVHSGPTSSSNTGPSLAYDGSYYAYTEASGSGYPGKTAILESDEFSIDSTSKIYFRYHMYGSTMGTLYLEVATTPYSSWIEIWMATGNLGEIWNVQTSALNSYSGQTIKLRFRGVTGTNYYSDMAIDYLYVYNLAAEDFTLDVGVADILTTSSQISTAQFEGLPQPVNFLVQVSAEDVYSGAMTTAQDSIDITILEDCVPLTCATSPYECGTGWDDGCGGTFDCPICSGADTCEAGICVAPCVPLTCANYPGQCGSSLDDGCLGTIDCSNVCSSGYLCDAGVCKLFGFDIEVGY